MFFRAAKLRTQLMKSRVGRERMTQPPSVGRPGEGVPHQASEREDDAEMELQNYQDVKVEFEGKKIPLREFIAQRRAKFGDLPADHTVTIKDLNYFFKVKTTTVKTIADLFAPKRAEKKTQVILKDISFCLKPKSLTIILGGPNSGKTPLLNIIAQRKKIANRASCVRGEIRVDGQIPNPKEYHRHLSYVEQTDIHAQRLTVWETLYFAAKLTMPNQFKDDEIRTRVDVILQVLGLKHRADTLVGGPLLRGISGGEMRRLTIGVEVIKGPSFFIMDEPTTGLDASSALLVGRLLKIVASFGAPVICTLLQPSHELLSLFDNVIIMSGGNIAYWGPTDEALRYFENLGYRCPKNYGVAEFLNEVVDYPERFASSDQENQLAVRSSEDFINSWNNSDMKQRMLAGFDEHQQTSGAEASSLATAAESTYAKSRIVQIWWTLWRGYKIILRDLLSLGIRLLNMIFIALIVGGFFFREDSSQRDARLKLGLIFGVLTRSGFASLAVVQEMFTERPLYYHQRIAGVYSAFSYFASTTLLQFPYAIVDSFAFGSIVYWMGGLRSNAWAFLYFILILLILYLIGDALVRAICGVFSRSIFASLTAASILAVLLLFSGYLIPKNQIRGWWIWAYYISMFSYAFNGILVFEFDGRKLHCTRSEFVPPSSLPLLNEPYPIGFSGNQICPFTTGDAFVKSFGYFNGERFEWIMFLGLIGLWFVMLVLFYLSVQIILGPRGRAPPIYKEKTKVKGEEKASNPPEPGKAAMTFEDIEYFVKTKETKNLQLLDHVNGYVKPGMILALMGGSGTGKSTLLDVIARRKTGGRIAGTVKVNGKDPGKFFHRFMGYVEQSDMHYPNQTVREALEFAAKTRLEDTSKEQRDQLIAHILELLDLNSLAGRAIGIAGVGGALSGEERKRVSIGVELAANPPILFLDEPTSGLDATGARKVISALRKVSKTGISIICTIHQPSSQVFSKMTHLLLLTRGGKQVYFGALGENFKDILGYMSDAGYECEPLKNPADFVIDVSSNHGPELIEKWKNSEQYQKLKSELKEGVSIREDEKEPVFKRSYARSLPVQFWLVCKRFLIGYWRSPKDFAFYVAMNLILAIVFGTAYWRLPHHVKDSSLRVSLLYFAQIVGDFIAFSYLYPVYEARPWYYREVAEGMYTSEAFVLARTVSNIPGVMLVTFVFAVPLYWMAGLRQSADEFFFFLLVMFGLYLASIAAAELLMTVNPTPVTAALIFGSFLAILSLSAGFLIRRHEIPSYFIWIYWISIFHWSLEALVINEFRGLTLTCPNGSGAYQIPISDGITKEYCPFQTGVQFLNFFQLHPQNVWKWIDVAVIYGYFIVFVILMLLGNRFISFQKR